MSVIDILLNRKGYVSIIYGGYDIHHQWIIIVEYMDDGLASVKLSISELQEWAKRLCNI